MDQDIRFLEQAIRLSRASMAAGGGPFGALVVRGDQILGRGGNRVTLDLDPTAHAEVLAIRAACRCLEDYSLAGCVLYSSCEPCPMCLGAAHWARVDRIVYAAGREDAAAAGFQDADLYRELQRPPEQRQLPSRQALVDEARGVLTDWLQLPTRVPY